jgi:FG-GAP-like repeat/Abnormal spindle-like microcephaly-assoc'd, ASPM-SPD-2-Hydin/FG-GAP repeat
MLAATKARSLIIAAIIAVIWSGVSASAQSYEFGVGAFTVAQAPQAIVSADFNGDGRPDLAIADNNGISVLLGGSFSNRKDYSTGEFTPVSLAVGDINGDGKPDLIAAADATSEIWILLGNGDGTFQPMQTLKVANLGPYGITGIAVGDFNKDGHQDLALAAADNSDDPVVAVLLGNGNGTFQTAVTYPTAGSSRVITGDFNGDGNLDLAVSGMGTISLLLGNGNGTFQAYQPISFPSTGPTAIAAADLNRDGKLDLVVASDNSSYRYGVSVLLGNGNGTFQDAVFYPVLLLDSFSSGIAVGDFNGDGKPDVAVTNYDGNDVSVFLGVGDGTLKSAVDYPGSINPKGLVVGDFNGDGNQDIASVAGYLISAAVNVLIGRGDGTFAAHTNHGVPLYPYDMAAGDFNGDGIPDLVVDSFQSPGTVSVLLGKGNGGFNDYIQTKVGNVPAFLATGDFNGDGKLDVVFNDTNPTNGAEELKTLLGRGNGTFEAPLTQTLTAVTSNLAVADFNLDGKPDLVTCLQLTTGVSVFLGKGDGSFSAPAFFDAGNSTSAANAGPVFAADFNGDGRPDIVVSTYYGISILLGDGNGSFQPYKAILPGYSLLAVGDFNGDGKPDLVVYASPYVGIALGNGNGTFKAPTLLYVPQYLIDDRILAGDFNGDGKLDLAFIDSTEQMLSILPGNGNGTFGQRIDLPTENSPWSLAAADFNGDGSTDFVVGIANLGTTGAVSVYLNRPVGTLYPTALQFGSQAVGSKGKWLSTSLHNAGGGPLQISSISISGPFAQTNTCGEVLDVGSSCTISVTFKPVAAGSQKGSLSIVDNAAVKPQTISLTGVGVE